MPLAHGTRILTVAFAVSGTIHLLLPKTFAPVMPSWVPAHREVIVASGVAELVLAAGLNLPATRRLSGWGSAVLLAAVFPANVKMATDSTKTNSVPFKAAAFGRLPLQAPLIRSALRAARG
ncbi:DoxX family protein [Nocardioides sp. Kera G14]|uniref:DoxX family protein n=1 Tax=Nocardioides sp. Kera G14 TaxID=2884264 RepID=UPI001D11F9E6|nr:DoxX family protein [Nocardioides sp. Kera G14]UDY22577.1 DoxX family protein [Nocardioides sp. Kera G14]